MKARINTLITNINAMFHGNPYSVFYIKSNHSQWVLDNETKEMINVASMLSVESKSTGRLFANIPQCLHYPCHFEMTNNNIYKTKHRISFDYFHGLPHQGSVFAECYSLLCSMHKRISKVRVSQSKMEELVLSSGIDPAKVHRIPIGINLSYFPIKNSDSLIKVRAELGLPQTAVVVGSFQKDGEGWGDGFEPKLVKGPDVFLKAIEILKRSVPELYVLLTGPARGYIKNGLNKIGVPFVHRYVKNYSEIGYYFQALDLYVIASREEGGPKAVLESMASGVPLVTTRVGQAMDIVKDGVNGWMVEIEDAEALADRAYQAINAINTSSNIRNIINMGRLTAEANTYQAQLPLWKKFFDGYVESSGIV